jgi:hypothetical protein
MAVTYALPNGNAHSPPNRSETAAALNDRPAARRDDGAA